MTGQRVATCPTVALKSDRACLVCHWPVLPGGGVAYPHLHVIVHQGECSEVLTSLHRDYERSLRGRWRQPKVVRIAANGPRCDECTAPRDPTEDEIDGWLRVPEGWPNDDQPGGAA